MGQVLEPLQGRLHWLLRQNDRPEVVCGEHEALYEAIAAGRPGQAAKIAAKHVRTSRDLAASVLFRDGQKETSPPDER